MVKFFFKVANDPRISTHDKAILLTLIGLTVQPFDFIPDFIPIIGQLDDLLYIALILDYFAEVIDKQILTDHWPYSVKWLDRLLTISRLVGYLVPNFIKRRLWKKQIG